MLKAAYENGRPDQIEVENEFTQSVTAAAGHKASPFSVSQLKAALVLLPGVPMQAPSALPARWEWASKKVFRWLNVPTDTGSASMTMLSGGGTSAAPAAWQAGPQSGDAELSMPEAPWHIRMPTPTTILMWDDRGWLFPTSTAKKWTPRK
ncbi:MAG: hypothetical protein KA004_01320 [Verrucomicrobiales bacterium]|nr:hypothetical protein [Verrucomicrobiales bacterium]